MLDHYHMKFHILLHNFEYHDITEMTAKVGVKHQRNCQPEQQRNCRPEQ